MSSGNPADTWTPWELIGGRTLGQLLWEFSYPNFSVRCATECQTATTSKTPEMWCVPFFPHSSSEKTHHHTSSTFNHHHFISSNLVGFSWFSYICSSCGFPSPHSCRLKLEPVMALSTRILVDLACVAVISSWAYLIFKLGKKQQQVNWCKCRWVMTCFREVINKLSVIV